MRPKHSRQMRPNIRLSDENLPKNRLLFVLGDQNLIINKVGERFATKNATFFVRNSL